MSDARVYDPKAYRPVRSTDEMRLDCTDYARMLAELSYDVQMIRWSAARDNYEPVPRVIAHGYAVAYSGTLTRRDDAGQVTFRAEYPSEGIVMACDDVNGMPLGNAIGSIGLFDYGTRVDARYAAGYNPWQTEAQRDATMHMPGGPSIQWHTMSLDGVNPVNGKAVDMSNWMLGPRRAYHFKVTPMYLHGAGDWREYEPA
jgi:hypothetical protein